MTSQHSLLLLPALDQTAAPSSLKSAYKGTFESLFRRLSSNDETISRLDIGLFLSSSYPEVAASTSRSAIFDQIQNVLKGTYSLVCATAATEGIDLDLPGGIDVRLLILEPRTEVVEREAVGKQILSGPIVDVETFVSSDRSYGTIYSTEGETAEVQLKQYLTTWGSKRKDEPPPVVRLPSGPAMVHSQPSDSTPDKVSRPNHASVAVGGTFDHLHIGHKLLLTGTILASQPYTSTPRTITIGITGDELLVNKKFGSHVESWTARQERTAEFVDSILAFYPAKSSPNHGAQGVRTTEYIDNPGPNGKIVKVVYHHTSQASSSGTDHPGSITINYTQISDPFGPTITDPDISAIVISAETRAGGKAVNDKRKEKGWPELEVFEVGILDASVNGEDEEPTTTQENFATKISSTEIRRRLQEKNQGHL
jgi:phosphopantetheine adenylyltransferase